MSSHTVQSEPGPSDDRWASSVKFIWCGSRMTLSLPLPVTFTGNLCFPSLQLVAPLDQKSWLLGKMRLMETIFHQKTCPLT